MLPGGLQVPADFKYEYPSSAGSNSILSSVPLYVTNADYEKRINDEKSDIFILNSKYIYDYVREFKNYGRTVKEQESFISIDDITP